MSKVRENKRWSHESYVIPGTPMLSRHNEEYFIEAMQGAMKIPVDFVTGVRLETYIKGMHSEEARKDMRSFSFLWARFWYRLKHKKMFHV